jgi:hypothetical protein
VSHSVERLMCQGTENGLWLTATTPMRKLGSGSSLTQLTPGWQPWQRTKGQDLAKPQFLTQDCESTCLKPLSFDVICHTAVNNWNTRGSSRQHSGGHGLPWPCPRADTAPATTHGGFLVSVYLSKKIQKSDMVQ